MTVATTDAGVLRLGNGATITFPFNFPARQEADVSVSFLDNGIETKQSRATFTVALAPDKNSGTVTFAVAPANMQSIYLYRDSPRTQLVSVSSQLKYDPKVVESVWDKLTLLLQEQYAELARTVKTLPGEDPNVLIATLLQASLDAVAAAGAADADALQTAADRVQTGLDRVATGADRVQTGLYAVATNADAIDTAADRVQTGFDRAATGQDAIDTAADAVQTGLDRVQTSADRVQTGLDAGAAQQAAIDAGVAAGVIANIPKDNIIGRKSVGTGPVEALTPSEARTVMGLASQSSKTDTTSGRLLAVGAFGLGEVAIAPLLANLDATGTAGGLWRYSAATTGTKPAGISADGVVLVMRGKDATSLSQLLISGDSYTVWARSCATGTWGPWAYLIAPPNLTKTQAEDPASTVFGAVSGERLGESIKANLNATGSAPMFACRAWVNFNGVGTVAIRASGNVSSITDLGVGRYQINFATAMPDANYAVADSISGVTIADSIGGAESYLAASVIMNTRNGTNAQADRDIISVSIFR